MKETAWLVSAAKPEPLSIDLSRTAVLVVDMQNDFAASGGMFARAGIDISLIRKALGRLSQSIERSVGVSLWEGSGYEPKTAAGDA
jgi:ureidoacrylate peracid hydrolase